MWKFMSLNWAHLYSIRMWKGQTLTIHSLISNNSQNSNTPATHTHTGLLQEHDLIQRKGVLSMLILILLH